MAHEPHDSRDGCEPGVCDQPRQLISRVGASHGEGAVVARVSAPRDRMEEEPGPDPVRPAPDEVVDDDAVPRDPAQLDEEGNHLVRLEVMENERGVSDIEGVVGVREAATVGDRQHEARDVLDRRACRDCSREHLWPAVDGGDRQGLAVGSGAGEEPHRDVGRAGPDVEDRRRRPERFDRALRQARPAGQAIDPGEIEQVGDERRLVIKRTVEQLGDPGEAIHRAKRTEETPRGPSCRQNGPMIVVAGESLVDRVVARDGRVRTTLGGGPYNVARAVARLDRPAAFLGRISTDEHGRMLRARLADEGVDLRLVRSTDDPTLIAHASVDEQGAATYRFETDGTAAAGLSLDDVRDGLPPGTIALHVGTLGLVLEPMAGTIAAVVAATPPGVLVVLDPNIRPAAIADSAGYRRRLDDVLGRADVVKVSTDDLAWLHPDRDPVIAARRLIDRGPEVVLVTDGSRPVRVVTADDLVTLPVPNVPVVDTIGAGDAFGAGFLAAWTGAGQHRTELADLAAITAATQLAVEVGAWTVGRAGADPPTRAQLGPLMRGW